MTNRGLFLVLLCALWPHPGFAGDAKPSPSPEELKAQILQHLAPDMEELKGFHFQFSYSFEGCTFVTKQTYMVPSPPHNADDWSESVSWVPLQSINPDRVRLGANGVYLFTAGDRRVLVVRDRWLGAVAEGRPFERTSFGEFHYYFARRNEQDVLAQEFRELIRLCGGTPHPPELPPKPIVESIAGIRVGTDASLEPAVQKDLGPGLYLASATIGEGRYFIDPTRSITLHLRSNAAHEIIHVELAEGVVLPEELSPSAPALVSPALSRHPQIDLGLELGMSYDQVLQKLGRPKTDTQTAQERFLSYEVDAQDNPKVQQAWVAFLKLAKDRLVSLSIEEGKR